MPINPSRQAAKGMAGLTSSALCIAGALLFTTKRGRVASAAALPAATVDRSAPIWIVRERSAVFPRLSKTSMMRGMLFEIVPKIANAAAQMANKNKAETNTNI
jgi:hypothetical protein